jgi:LacI family transcriptional regulator
MAISTGIGGGDAIRINIKTVASHAGVSPATVSRVLNTPELVGQETKARVLAAMEALNYHPSGVARSLSTQKSRTIGVIVPGISAHFFIDLHKGIHEAAAAIGMDVLLYDSKRATGNIVDGFYTLKRRQIDGIIFSSGYLTQEYEMVIARLGIPVVLVLTESANQGLTAFKVDDIRACFDAISYLIARGHRNIAMISGPLDEPVAGKSRYDGYCLALQHYDIPVREELLAVGSDYHYESGYKAMNEILSRDSRPEFTAVFAACDDIALGAMRALYEAGLKVPDDVSVMGFDDVSVANMVTPKLTTVKQPFYQIGARAVQALNDIIEDNPNRLPPGVHYMPHQVIGRESVTTVPIR